MKNHTFSIALVIGALLVETFWFIFALGNAEKINTTQYWTASLISLCVAFGIGELSTYFARKLQKGRYASVIISILLLLTLFYMFGIKFFVA